MTTYLRSAGALSPGRTMLSPYFDADTRDQTLIQMPTAPPTFPAFKFESRKTRIDWRLLHGVDINPIVSLHHDQGGIVLYDRGAMRCRLVPVPLRHAMGHMPGPKTHHHIVVLHRSETLTWTPWKRSPRLLPSVTLRLRIRGTLPNSTSLRSEESPPPLCCSHSSSHSPYSSISWQGCV